MEVQHPKKPVIFIVPGAWHTPHHYIKLIKELETADYEVHCPRLLSVSQERPPTASLAEDVQNIRSEAEKLIDSGHHLVAILHSYGGLVGGDALHSLDLQTRSDKGLPGGVSHLVYMCAYALLEGGSLFGEARAMGLEQNLQETYDFAEDMTGVCRDPKILVGEYGNELELQEYLDALLRWNGQAIYE
ncbi:Alpha/beta hydrolase nvfD [Cladobotryum mycophilum]|uniref:Alpha/beta hydrolase nvfD n=1 Tax=Cladobotryum mycophilum TaxID=491253 RepID=A0ABR0SVW5_9HYPO